MQKKSIIPILTISCVLFTGSAMAECLEISEKALNEKRSDYGLVTAEWSAKIQNKCEGPYDGTLKIKIMDKDEKLLQSITDIVILGANEEKESRRTITIPAESIDVVDRIDVEIRERERPR